MAEPQTSVAAVLVALLSPLTGPFSVIVFAALAGATWPLAAADTATRKQGAFLLIRLVLTSAALTGFIAFMVEQQFGFPANKVLAPVAFLIAWFGDAWRDPGALVGKATAMARQIKGVFTGGGQ